jgi:uncharacterized repeat protein (TIGR04076 family)
MVRCKITVIKKQLNLKLAKEYCQCEVTTCQCFEAGQEFFTTGFEKPADFCDWAWNDLHQYIAVLLAGGNFSSGIFEGWMKEDRTMIACCTDGIRPVVFKIEKIDN